MSNLLKGWGTVWEKARKTPPQLPPLLTKTAVAYPLGTYETKIVARTGKRSTLMMLRKKMGDSEFRVVKLHVQHHPFIVQNKKRHPPIGLDFLLREENVFTHPSPKPTLTLVSHSSQNLGWGGLGENRLTKRLLNSSYVRDA